MTVSRALKPESPVSPVTRRRVLEAIDKLGYVPDMSAGALSSRRSRLVAVLIPSLLHPKNVETAQAISDTLATRDIQVLLVDTQGRLDREERMIETVLRRRPEAIVLPGGMHSDRTAILLRRAQVPIIETGARPQKPIEHFIGLSMRLGARAVLEHLRAKGRSRIGFVDAGADITGQISDYAEGYAQALRDLDLGAPRIISGGRAESPYERGGRGLARLLDAHPDTDAVLFTCDRSGVGGLIEARRRRMDVPEQLSLVGFGNFDVGRDMVPALTTAGINAAGMGAEVAKTILTALETRERGSVMPPLDRLLDIHVIPRGTS